MKGILSDILINKIHNNEKISVENITSVLNEKIVNLKKQLTLMKKKLQI